MAEKEMQPKAKEEAPAKAERVRPGRVFLPAVDIFETPETLVLVADMPGVPSDQVTLDIRDHNLTITGEIRPPWGNMNPCWCKSSIPAITKGNSNWGPASTGTASKPP